MSELDEISRLLPAGTGVSKMLLEQAKVSSFPPAFPVEVWHCGLGRRPVIAAPLEGLVSCVAVSGADF